jgi:large subunit ribosomal protein L5
MADKVISKEDKVAKTVAPVKTAVALAKSTTAPKAAAAAPAPKVAPAKVAEAKAPKAPKVATGGINNRLHVKYKKEVVPALMKSQGYKNINAVPRIDKVVINIGLGDCKDNTKSFQMAVDEIGLITGQKPIITLAKKSISNFKLREGQKIGAKVTLRGQRMYEFLDKLISIALPRVRDFRGISPKSFDQFGNYALGIKEQLVFPEISYEKIEKVRGFDIAIITTAKTSAESLALLTELGFPFRKA